MITHLFAATPVADLKASMRWYGRLFGRSADLIPNDREAAWQVREGAWICLVADEPRAGSGVDTLLVDNLDAFMRALAERGIEAPPLETSQAGRSMTLVDPDGNVLKVAQPFLI